MVNATKIGQGVRACGSAVGWAGERHIFLLIILHCLELFCLDVVSAATATAATT